MQLTHIIFVEKAIKYQKKLNKVLPERGTDAIYSLADWLNALNLKLRVAVKQEE